MLSWLKQSRDRSSKKKEAKAKIDALEKKAAKAKGEAKANIEKRIAQIKEKEQDSSGRLR